MAIPSGYSCPLAMGLAKLDELDRQHPSPSSSQLFYDRIEGIPLPAVVCSLLNEKHLDQSSCVAIALSGAFPAFSSSYGSSRYKLLKVKPEHYKNILFSTSNFVLQKTKGFGH